MKTLKFKWKINRKPIPYPTTTPVVWTGSEVFPEWTDADTSLTVSGQLSATDPGDYDVTFTLDSNHCWMNGDTEPYTTTWSLTALTIDAMPTQTGTLTYTGSALTPEWDNFNTAQLSIEVTPQTDAGSYEAVFTPKTGYTWADGTTTSKSASWTIAKASVTPPIVDGIYVYTGSEQTVTVTGYDSVKMTQTGTDKATSVGSYTLLYLPTANYKWPEGTATDSQGRYVLTWSIGTSELAPPTVAGPFFYKNGQTVTLELNGFSADAMTLSGDTSGINAGTYTAYITLSDDYSWQSDTPIDDQGRYVIEWEIQRDYVNPVIQSGTLTYNGEEQTVTLSKHDSIIVTGPTSGTNAGDYTITVSLDDNHMWHDGTITPKQIIWTIGRAAVALPSQSETLTYTGSAQTPTWTVTEGLIFDGVLTGTDAGSYDASITPDSNHQWTGGSTEAKTVTWTIGRVAINVPVQSNTLTYNGSAQYPEWSSTEGMTLLSSVPSATNAGSYNMTAKLDANHCWTDGDTTDKTLTWTIGRAVVQVPAQSIELNYTGAEQTVTWTVSEGIIFTGTTSATEAATYNAIATPDDNHQWPDSTYTSKDISWTIKTVALTAPTITGGTYSVTYDEAQHTVPITGYDAEKMIQQGTASATNAGTYIVYFTPKTGYVWQEGTTVNAAGQVELSWTINKAQGVLNVNPTSLTFAGLGSEWTQEITVTTNVPEGITVTCTPEGIVEVSVVEN